MIQSVIKWSPQMVDMIKDSHYSVRSAAVNTFGLLAQRTQQFISESQPKIDVDLEILQDTIKPTIPQLFGMIGDPDIGVRWGTVAVLEQLLHYG
jgi:hypothetical protein